MCVLCMCVVYLCACMQTCIYMYHLCFKIWYLKILNHYVRSHEDNILSWDICQVLWWAGSIRYVNSDMIMYELIKSLARVTLLSSTPAWAPEFSLWHWFSSWPSISKLWPQFRNLKDQKASSIFFWLCYVWLQPPRRVFLLRFTGE